MISDTERREVARRLREAAEAHPDMSLILNLAFADDSLKPEGAMEWTVTSHDAAMRLADLIEPPTQCPYYHSDRHYCSIHDVPAIDRDALLALADEMERELDECASDHEIAGNLQSQIDRIREACGRDESASWRRGGGARGDR